VTDGEAALRPARTPSERRNRGLAPSANDLIASGHRRSRQPRSFQPSGRLRASVKRSGLAPPNRGPGVVCHHCFALRCADRKPIVCSRKARLKTPHKSDSLTGGEEVETEALTVRANKGQNNAWSRNRVGPSVRDTIGKTSSFHDHVITPVLNITEPVVGSPDFFRAVEDVAYFLRIQDRS
jgi:hypothetical protein